MPKQRTDVVRVLPAGSPTNQGENIYVNCFPESVENSLTQVKRAYCVKRKGLKNTFKSIASTGEARGIYYWDANQVTYFAYGSALNAINSSGNQVIGFPLPLTTSTGPVNFTETSFGEIRQLFMSDGDKGYLFNDDVDNSTTSTASITITGVNNWVPDGYWYAPSPTDPKPPYTVTGGGGTGLELDIQTSTQVVTSGLLRTTISAITVSNPGTGYTSLPTVTIGNIWVANTVTVYGDTWVTSSGKRYAMAVGATTTGTVEPSHTSGTVNNFIFIGYNSSIVLTYNSEPDTSIDDTPGAVTVLYNDSVSDIIVTSEGSNYLTAPTVNFSGGGGSGATATAYLNGGAVISIIVTNGGSGYTSAPTITLGTNWATGQVVSIGSYRNNANKVYYATNTATTGVTPPTHTSGTVTDGGVLWTYVGNQATATAELSAFPSPHVPFPVFMDGVIFLAKEDTNVVYNSNTENIQKWSSSASISVNQFPGNINALARLQNYVLALKTDAIEYLYNNGSVDGSVLSKTTQAASAVGCPQPGTVQVIEDDLLFVGQSAGGGFSVWKVGNFKEEKLSNELIDEYLNERYGLYNNTAKDKYFLSGSVIRVDGHKFYIINEVGTTSGLRAMVYDLDEKFWSFWDSSSNSATKRFIGVHSCTKNGISLVQSDISGGNGRILYHPTTSINGDYNDGGSVYYSFYNTPVVDMDNRYRKRFNRVEVVGNKYSYSVPVYIRYSDNNQEDLDYLTSGGWTVSMQTGYQSYVNNLGSSRSRIWQVSTNTDVPFRWESFEIFYDQGVH